MNFRAEGLQTELSHFGIESAILPGDGQFRDAAGLRCIHTLFSGEQQSQKKWLHVAFLWAADIKTLWDESTALTGAGDSVTPLEWPRGTVHCFHLGCWHQDLMRWEHSSDQGRGQCHSPGVTKRYSLDCCCGVSQRTMTYQSFGLVNSVPPTSVFSLYEATQGKGIV